MKNLNWLSGLVLFIAVSHSFANERKLPIPLEAAVAAINVEVAISGLDIMPLTIECLLDAYRSRREYSFDKNEREMMDQALAAGRLPPGYAFSIVSYPGLSPRIDLNYISIVEGRRCETWETQFLPHLETSPPAMDENEFSGTPALESATGQFPSSVPIQIREIVLSIRAYDEDVHVPALDIQFKISHQNIGDLAAYFGTGYCAEKTREKLTHLLGQRKDLWISIRDLLRGWPAQWVNRFPYEKANLDGHSANDVCYGVSRQFFRDELSNGGLDRSTEATAWMLKQYYRMLPDTAEPTFGDYLYLPGAHGIRFIMKDPNSGRWVGFTAWSDSRTPYRLWWVDRDYASPYHPDVPARAEFPRSMDLWRRIAPTASSRFIF